MQYYGCDATYEALFEATYEDWRFAKAEDIAVDGVIPERRPSGWKMIPSGALSPKSSRPCWTSRERIGRGCEEGAGRN